MALIPSVPLRKLQALNVIQFKELPSLVIVDEKGDYLATLIVPSVVGGATIYNEIKTQAEYLGVRGNIVVPASVKEAVNNLPPIQESYPNLIKARACRKAKREQKEVVSV